MTSDVDSPMNVVASRQLSSTSICQYYRYSGTCRYRRCDSSHVREALPSDGPYKQERLPSVHERPWVLTSEEESSCEEGSAEAWRFSLASYNILADKYAKHYRSYLYHDVPSGYLDWNHRKSAIIAELAHLQPDIICLQEVDRYEDLESQLQQLGYSGIYLQRDGGRRDGCATFWRSSLLRPALVRQLRYSQYDLKDNVALLVLFEPHSTAMGDQQEHSQQQQQMQPPLISQQLAQQQLQEQQQEQQHKQDLLSQWLPRNWLHSGHHQHLKHHNQHKQLSRSASVNLYGTSPGDLYQQPEGPLHHSHSLDSNRGYINKGARSSRRNSRYKNSRLDDRHSLPSEADSGGDTEQRSVAQYPLQLAPDWLNCGVLVANTHIIFTPEKGEVKLGQARMLLQEAAQMAQWYLSHQQEQQSAQAAAQGSSSGGKAPNRKHKQECRSNSRAPHGVVTIVAGDFNAVPQSPMYSFMAHGCVNLHKVSKRNVSHMAGGGSPLHKGYKGFRRARKRMSMDEQRRSLEQRRTSLDAQQQQQWQYGASEQQGSASCRSQREDSSNSQEQRPMDSGFASLAMNSYSGVASVAGNAQLVQLDPASAAKVHGVQQQRQQSATRNNLWRSNTAVPEVTNAVDSSPVRSSSLSSYLGLSSPNHSSKVHRWSDKDCRRAAGMSYDELVEDSSTAGPVASADRLASPNTKIARAAAAFGQRVAAGAGAAAASVAASVAAELGRGLAGESSPVDESGVKPLLLRHSMSLRSSYVDVLGHEPEYTSSHSQFMDTCDYIWYTDTALCSTQGQQGSKQQQYQCGVSCSQPADCESATATATSTEVGKYEQQSESAAEVQLQGDVADGYDLRPVAVLVPPDGMKLPKGLPSRWLGSDHVCLVADFSLSRKRV